MIAAQGTTAAASRALRNMTALRRRVLPSSSSSSPTKILFSTAGRSLLDDVGSSSSTSKSSFRSFSSSSSSSAAEDDDSRIAAAVASLTDQERAFYKQGLVDERGLTIFDTLHEMQVRSCQVYASHPLFGTFSNETNKFEWTTFEYFQDRVDTCRALFQDLGKEK